MSKFSRAVVVASLAILTVACSKFTDNTSADKSSADSSIALKTDAQKFGYAVGYDLGHSMKPMLSLIDVKSLKTGIDQGSSGQPALMDAKARQQIKTTMAEKMHAKQEQDRKTAAGKNTTDSEKFLADMAKKPGVKTTKDGLEYEVEKEGEGTPPTPDDKVTVNYRGTLPDGTEFDSSYKRKEPLTFPLKNVIPGWIEGLQLMKPGAKYKFYIPAELAYGERGAGEKIGPNQALVFDVELLKVEKSDTSDKSSADDSKSDDKSTAGKSTAGKSVAGKSTDDKSAK